MSKITKIRKRQIRSMVNAIAASKLKQISLAGFTEDPTEQEVAYAEAYLKDHITRFETCVAVTGGVE